MLTRGEHKELEKQVKKHEKLRAPINRCLWMVPKSMNPLEPLSKEEIEMLSDINWLTKKERKRHVWKK